MELVQFMIFIIHITNSNYFQIFVKQLQLYYEIKNYICPEIVDFNYNSKTVTNFVYLKGYL
jgi:hypothetical protein